MPAATAQQHTQTKTPSFLLAYKGQMGWQTVATVMCKSESYREQLKEFQTEWLPAFCDPVNAAGSPIGTSHTNPTGRWGPRGGNSTYKYWECRAHTNCTRVLRTTRAKGGGLFVQADGQHSGQVRDSWCINVECVVNRSGCMMNLVAIRTGSPQFLLNPI